MLLRFALYVPEFIELLVCRALPAYHIFRRKVLRPSQAVFIESYDRCQNFIVDNPLSDTSHDDEKRVMIGTIPVQLPKSTEKNSIPLKYLMIGSIPVQMPKSAKKNSIPLLNSTVYECSKSKRKTRVDIGSAHANGNATSESRFDSSFYESPQTWKKKPASSSRPYKTQNKIRFASAGHEMDSLVRVTKFKPYDICWFGQRNSGLFRCLPIQKNEEICFEMQQDEDIKKGILMPGMILLKNYLTHDEQVEIVKICRELGLGPGGFYQPGYAGGAKLRLKMMCLGMDWDPQTRKYDHKRVIDGSKPPSIPSCFSEFVIRSIEEAHSLIGEEYGGSSEDVEDILPSMTPDVCIVNFYTTSGRLGLHQDRDESRESLRRGLPVVSFSIGDSAEFLYGNQRDIDMAERVLLESGDVLIFGGESRHVFHGVSSIIPNSAPEELLHDTRLLPGRLNLTFRQY